MSELSKQRVLLAQLPHPAYTDRNIPLAAGYLKASAHAHGLLDKVDVEILDPGVSDHAGCQVLIDTILSLAPQILGVSLYLWNVRRTLYIVEKVKAEMPDIIVLAGGPEVARDSDEILSNPCIDYAVIGEGEITFVELVGSVLYGQPACEDIAGLCYRRNGHTVVNRPRKRIADLEWIPSPYLLGYLDPQDHREMMLFTMRGCMEGCTYCSWTSRGKLRAFALDRLRQELILARSSGVGMRVSILDSAFNASPVFRQFCAMAREINKDKTLQFDCFVRADLVDEAAASLLKSCNFASVEIGLQSTNRGVLASVNRSIALADFLRSAKILDQAGIPFIVDTILGLPGDTPESFEGTMAFVAQNQLKPMVFNLSLGHGARLRRQANEFGATVQSAPPFYVLQTDTFHSEDLKSAMLRHVEASADLNKLVNLHYPCILSDAALNEHRLVNSDDSLLPEIRQPIRNLVLRMDEPPARSSRLESLIDLLSCAVANTVSLMWISDRETLVRSLWLMKMLLETVTRRNPHTVWDIHLQLGEYGPSQALVDTILSFVNRPKVFLDYRDELIPGSLRCVRGRSASVFFHVSGDNAACPLPVAESNLLRTSTVVDSQDLGTEIEELSQATGSGLLVDFPPNSRTDFVRRSMNLLVKLKRQVFFRDWVIQRLWERDYLKITPQRMSHYELLVDKDLGLFGKHYDEGGLLWDALTKWNIIRPEFADMDLEGLIAERVAAKLSAE